MKAVLVALVAALCAVCAGGYISRDAIASSVEARLAERVQRSGLLAEARFSNLVISHDHLTAVVEGTVATEARREEFLAELKEAMGAGRVVTKITVAPPVPAQLRIVRDGAKVEISGTVADPGVFAGLVTSLSAQEGIESVQNNLLASERTLPIPQPEALSAAALALVAGSPSSSFALENGELIVEAVLAKPTAKDALLAKLVPVYDGTYQFVDKLTISDPAPAAVYLEQDQTGAYVLRGILPSEEFRIALQAVFPDAAGVRNENLAVHDYLNTPSWFTSLPAVLQKITGSVADLQFIAVDQSLILKGTVASVDQSKEVQEFVTELLPGWSMSSD